MYAHINIIGTYYIYYIIVQSGAERNIRLLVILYYILYTRRSCLIIFNNFHASVGDVCLFFIGRQSPEDEKSTSRRHRSNRKRVRYNSISAPNAKQRKPLDRASFLGFFFGLLLETMHSLHITPTTIVRVDRLKKYCEIIK